MSIETRRITEYSLNGGILYFFFETIKVTKVTKVTNPIGRQLGHA